MEVTLLVRSFSVRGSLLSEMMGPDAFKVFVLLGFLMSEGVCMKRPAPQNLDTGRCKSIKIAQYLVPFFDSLPDELFSQVLEEALSVGCGALANLALTCADHLDYIQRWSFNWLHGRPFMLTDKDSEELCCLALPFAEYILKNNFEDQEKSIVLSVIFSGMSTPKSMRTVYEFVDGIEISSDVKQLALQRMFSLSSSPVPFTSRIKLSEAVQIMIDVGKYRFLFAYLYLSKGSPDAAHVFSTAIDIFIFEHHCKDVDVDKDVDKVVQKPLGDEFLQFLIEIFPELWVFKFDQLCDSLTIYTLDGAEVSNEHPVLKAISDLTGGDHRLHLNDDSLISQRISSNETYFYSLILSGLMSGVFYEIEFYYPRMAAISVQCDTHLRKLFDAIQSTLHDLQAEDLRTWSWILKDLVQEYFFVQKPEMIKNVLFQMYLKQKDDETVQFLYGCFVPGNYDFENILEIFLKDTLEWNIPITDKLTTNHLVHILQILPGFNENAKKNCSQYLSQLLVKASEKLVATNDADLMQYFTRMFQLSPIFKIWLLGAVEGSGELRTFRSMLELITTSPKLEGESKQLIISPNL